MWKVMQAIVLFATAGLVFATQLSNSLGIHANPYLIVAVGLGFTTLLMYRSLASLLVMIAFAILINMSEDTLEVYGINRDIVLAFAIAMLCLPWLQRFTR